MMKIQLLFSLVIMSFSSNCFAQFVEVSHRESYSNQFSKFVRGSNGQFVIGDWYDQGTIAALYNPAADSIIWLTGYGNVVWDASVNEDGIVVLFVSSVGCDVVEASQLKRVEIAPDGEMLSSTTYPFEVYGAWDYGTALVQDIFYFFHHKILGIDSEGTPVFQTPSALGLGSFNVVMDGFENELLAFSDDGYLARFDQQGNFLDSTHFPQSVLSMERSPFGKLYGFAINTVFEFDSNLVMTDISTPLGLNGDIQDLLVDSIGILLLDDDEMLYRIDTSHTVSDQIGLSSYLEEGQLWLTDSGYYCSGTLGDLGVILRLDAALNVVSDIQVKWMKVNDLDVFDGKVWIAGTESHFPHQYDHPSALLKSFDLDLNTGNWQNDVELIGVTIDSFSTTINPSITFTYQYPTVEVRNSGQDTLHSLFLSYHNQPLGFGICELHELGWSEETLGLLPGEDTLITLPRIPWISYVQDPNGNGPTDLSLCVYAYNPNRKVDIEHDNNSTCVDFTINVGIEETIDREINVYPNPFNNELTIELSNGLRETTIRVSDVLGRTVLNQSYIGENRIDINTAGWPNGIYFLAIEMQDNSVVRKAVKR